MTAAELLRDAEAHVERAFEAVSQAEAKLSDPERTAALALRVSLGGDLRRLRTLATFTAAGAPR